MKEIVIKIDDGIYKLIMSMDKSLATTAIRPRIFDAIRNGKVLPKHGELITKGQAVALVQFYQQNPQHFSFENLIDDIDKEVPVIEEDTE